MKDIDTILQDLLYEEVKKFADVERGEIMFERPKREEQGDRATNIAMKLAKNLGKNPRTLADEIVKSLPQSDYIEKVEIAGPGFINFFLTPLWFAQTVKDIVRNPDTFGLSNRTGKRVQIEFVSANPTGPLHVGHGRGAAVGDTVGNLLAVAGWDVEKEYYLNDAGLQMQILGASTQSRYFEILGQPELAPFPEPSYKGDYIWTIAREIADKEGDRFLAVPLEDSVQFFGDYASRVILSDIENDLEEFGVKFDVWYSEKSLYARGLVESAMEFLKDKNFAFEHEGALWFKDDAGDDKDRVLIRSNGAPTYFASDIAYHKDKFDRGFSRLIDVWGADHHGYVPRMTAAISAIGQDERDFQVLLIQFVNLLRGGQLVPMSTRGGDFVTLRDVRREVGNDAARWFFLMRNSNSHLDFDLELAKQQNNENPVYYVQYAHARACSIKRECAERGFNNGEISADDFKIETLVEPEEKKLMACLAVFPQETMRAANELAPHILTNYVFELAGDFHAFYNAHRVMCDDTGRAASRMILVEAARIVIERALSILGIHAPERM